MKIGIYGGTFSPPHYGHVKAADAFFMCERLDRLMIIPTFIPPHKSEEFEVSPDDRLEMCILAFSGKGYEVSDIELRRKGRSYTFDTLTELRKKYVNDELLFLCGTDMLLSFDRWYRFEEIFGLCTLVCMRREEDISGEITKKINEKISCFREQYAAKVRLINVEPIEISSTEIRNRILENENVSSMLPDGVYDFIKKKGLYKNV